MALKGHLPQDPCDELEGDEDNNRRDVDHADGRDQLARWLQHRIGDLEEHLDNGVAGIEIGDPRHQDASKQDKDVDFNESRQKIAEHAYLFSFLLLVVAILR